MSKILLFLLALVATTGCSGNKGPEPSQMSQDEKLKALDDTPMPPGARDAAEQAVKGG
jgi:hypothetical protein